MEPWSDYNRFSQSGYSAPTVWPCIGNYVSTDIYLKDYQKALDREATRSEWLEDEAYEARREYLEQQAEAKAEREEWL